jgi:hypothetical protein
MKPPFKWPMDGVFVELGTGAQGYQKAVAAEAKRQGSELPESVTTKPQEPKHGFMGLFGIKTKAANVPAESKLRQARQGVKALCLEVLSQPEAEGRERLALRLALQDGFDLANIKCVLAMSPASEPSHGVYGSAARQYLAETAAKIRANEGLK